jgi:hypothetical protein
MQSGNLNFLEPSGPLQACNGTAFIMESMTSLDMRWTVRVSKPGGSEIFRNLSRPVLGTLTYKYNEHCVISELKRPGRGVDHSPPSSVEDKETVDLYLYF